MLIYFINTLEVVCALLLVLGFFQIRKHYVLFSNSLDQKTRPEQKLKTTKPQTAKRPAMSLEPKIQNKPQPDYYFHKLPEPEVSISSNQDLAFLSKKTPKPKPTRSPNPLGTPKSGLTTKHKGILNNYIDDFFSVSPPDEFQQAVFQEPVFQKAIDDEFITVVEDGVVNEQVANGHIVNEQVTDEQIVDELIAEKYLAQRHTAMYSNSIH